MTSRSLLTALLVGCRLVRGLRCAAPRPARALCRLRGKTRGVEPAAELEEYWSKHGQKWARPLELLDVRAAWASGECDGILPSGRPSRDSQDRMISVVRAQELYDSDALSVRRRYRNAGAAELAPRWARVLEARAGLVEAGRWDAAVAESAKRRDFEGALLRGEVESPEASPAASRAVATALSPLLKLAASQRDRADGGALTCFAELQETAGDDDEERPPARRSTVACWDNAPRRASNSGAGSPPRCSRTLRARWPRCSRAPSRDRRIRSKRTPRGIPRRETRASSRARRSPSSRSSCSSSSPAAGAAGTRRA